jgi:DNA processing protein
VTRELAAAVAGGAPVALVQRVLRLAASGWAVPDRVRDAVAGLLEDGAAPDADAVLSRLEALADDEQHPLAQPGGVERTAGRLREVGAAVHVVGTPGYPSALQLAWPELGAPVWLFSRTSDGRLPEGPAVAVVGTRQPSLDGLRTARELGAMLAAAGVVVVSGMARGIDQAAHRGALTAGGLTVGVLGTGFGVDYPHRCGELREAVAGSGGLVSEYLPGTPPLPRHFLWRNRIIAALADVTVVVEGRARSGALQTARLAAAQGREVLAVPGSVNAPTSRAPLDLIRDGARPMTRFEDVLEALDGLPRTAAAQQVVDVDLEETPHAVLRLLGPVPATATALAAASGRPVPEVLAAIADLNGRGLARLTPRGVVAST